MNRSSTSPSSPHWDHACPDYQTLLELGVGGILEKIREEQKKTRPAEEQEYLSAMEKAVGAFQSWLYSLAAFYRGKDDPHGHEKRLEAIASRPPSTFWEAVQLVWLVDLALALEERGAMAFGRMDQYLYPFYLKEINSGSMSREMTLELLCHLFAKLEEPLRLNPINNFALAGL
ncbi:MAG TPA: pyruvate formate lyase family protein, partial [Bacillota bacterium]|nr:pyruvate formate lyase family protein [Bacillota bacterium]